MVFKSNEKKGKRNSTAINFKYSVLVNSRFSTYIMLC